ncbi:uncharacterized protein [Gossypium hirsutum]|uniref:DUF7745 domain-containing protein n=1 Tax=Gossypium hirsutum TaxID=3635 RepID=A0ABM3AYP6_GOSHI|nr:uncharacterized protein LOC107942199 [Gossypium hirsutum]
MRLFVHGRRGYNQREGIAWQKDIRVDKNLFRALVQFWNSAYKCFTFGEVDLVPTMEEYTTLLRCPKIQVRKTYARVFSSQTFVKKLMSISGMSEPWVITRIQQKGDSKCIPWENLQDFILTHPDERKRVDIFALNVYRLVIFPKALRHVDEAVIDLFDRLEKGITPVLEDRQGAIHWMCTIIYGMVPRALLEGRQSFLSSLLQGLFPIERISSYTEERGYLRGEVDGHSSEPQVGGYRVESLLDGIWGAIGYTPLLALRQYKSRQFVPTTYGLAQSEFSFTGAHYKKRVRELSDAWKQTCWMKRLAVSSIVTPEYSEWFRKRIKDNIARPSLENTRPIGEQLQIAPSELEIIRQDFDKKSSELRKKIEQLKEEKMHLRLDADVQRSEAEKWRKGKTKAEEDLNSLKIDYKKLRLSMRTAGLAQARNEDLEKSLSKSRNERGELRARVAELEKSLHQYRNCNTAIELRASLSQIEEMKGRIGELEASL